MSFDHKIYTDYHSASSAVASWQQSGLEVCFTNGCFDLIHKGHIRYLEEAARLGDKLVVAVNADASVSRLKGEHRPIKDEETRALLLAAMSFIDMVIIFGEDTPLELITSLSPDILVKGGDWSIDQIVGSEHVINHGGVVKSLQFIPGHSTTSLEEKIKKS